MAPFYASIDKLTLLKDSDGSEFINMGSMRNTDELDAQLSQTLNDILETEQINPNDMDHMVNFFGMLKSIRFSGSKQSIPNESEEDKTANSIAIDKTSDEDEDDAMEDIQAATDSAELDGKYSKKNQKLRDQNGLESAIIDIYAIVSLFQTSQTKSTKGDTLLFVKNRSVTVLENLLKPCFEKKKGIEFVFDHFILKEKFYKFVKICFASPNKSQINQICALQKHISCKMNNVMNFFQVFTVKEMFKVRDYHSIYKLVKDNHIDSPNEVDSTMLDKKDIFLHYYIMAKGSMVSQNYQRAYQIFQTMFLITLPKKCKINKETVYYIMAEYILVLMKLNKDWKDTDFIMIKYTSEIPPELLDCYKSYSKGDYLPFIQKYLSYAIKCLPIDPTKVIDVLDNNMVYSQSTQFTELMLRQLCMSLLKKRYRLIGEKVHDKNILNMMISKPEIDTINEILSELEINVNLERILTEETEDTELGSTEKMISKTLDLAKINSKISDMIDQIRFSNLDKMDVDLT